jgi:RNA polymerase sigma factor (TIGR02999 family)
MAESPRDVTGLLLELAGGKRDVVDALVPLVYERLHDMARNQMRGERVHHTLSATALVHEAYLKLVDQTRVDWKNRAHFFAIAAQAMRRILINHAQRRLAAKRGAGQAMVTFDEELVGGDMRPEELLELDRALERLKQLSGRQVQVVEYRFFAGLTHQETGEVLGVSEATVRLDWRLARAWLSRELRAAG